MHVLKRLDTFAGPERRGHGSSVCRCDASKKLAKRPRQSHPPHQSSASKLRDKLSRKRRNARCGRPSPNSHHHATMIECRVASEARRAFCGSSFAHRSYATE
jgi:hypothetical protein